MEEHVEKTEVESQASENAPSKSYKRKRGRLLNKIRQQMEFYFGDSNLAKDRFLSERLGEDPDGYVNVELFLTFNKIRALTANTQDIVDALTSSEIIEVTSDGKQLRRKKPVERKDFDDCTIYVERLPPNASHKWLRDVFKRYGNVAHTSIPRFRMSGKIKGFAFIEFESPEGVLNACKHFKTSTESGESDTGEESDDPKDRKTSGKSKKSQGHYKEHQTSKGKDGMPHRSGKKRRRNESEGSERLGGSRKSVEREDAEGKSARLPSEVNGKNEAADAARGASELESCDEKSEMKSGGVREHLEALDPKGDTMSPQKSCRKRKTKDTSDNESTPKKVKYDPACSDASEMPKVQAVKSEPHHVSGSDSESKSGADTKSKCTNKESLKQSTSEVKAEVPCEGVAAVSRSADESGQEQKVASGVETDGEVSDSECIKSKKKKKRHRKKKNKPDDDRPPLRVLTKAEWKTYRNKYLTLQRASMVHVKKILSLQNQYPHCEEEGDADEDNYDQSPVKEEKQRHEALKFQPGVIIKLKLSEPVENCQKLREQLKSLADVRYVDCTEGSVDVYVRCSNPETASTIISEAQFAEFGDSKIVTGDDETTYWEKVLADRSAIFERKSSKGKKRGRDKVISRAAKMFGMNTHVHFDD